MTREELDARMERSRATVEDIRRRWEEAAAGGDLRAKRLLAECFGGAQPAIVDQPMPELPRTHVAISAEKLERESGSDDGDA